MPDSHALCRRLSITYVCTDLHVCTLAFSALHTGMCIKVTRARTHTHTHTQTQTRLLTHLLIHLHARARAHTHTHAFTHSFTRMHTHPHTTTTTNTNTNTSPTHTHPNCCQTSQTRFHTGSLVFFSCVCVRERERAHP